MRYGYWLWLLLLVLLTPALAQESSTETPPPTETASATVVPTIEPSPIPTATVEPIPTTTELPSASPTEMPSVTPAPTETSTVTLTLTDTPGVTPTASETLLGPETTETVEITPTETASPAETETATLTMTLSETPEATATSSATATATTVPMQPVFVETFESAYPNSWVRGPNSDVVYTLNPISGSLLVTDDVVYPLDIVLANSRLTFQFKLWSGALSVGLRSTDTETYLLVVDVTELRVYRNGLLVATAMHSTNLVGWTLLSIELVDGRMRVTLNHMPMLEWTDANPLPAGEIRFAAWHDLADIPSSFQMDNVLIESDAYTPPYATATFSAPGIPQSTTPIQDGEYYLITKRRNNFSVLFAVSIDKQTERQLTPASFSIIRPRVSPDGRWIAYLSTQANPSSPGYMLYIMRSDSGLVEQVPFNEPVGDLTWHPNGQKLAFVTAEDPGHTNVGRVMIFDTTTRQIQEVPVGDGIQPMRVRWSPNGMYIAFTSVCRSCGTANQPIRRLLFHDNQVTLLGNHENWQMVPLESSGFAWKPDSSGYWVTRTWNRDIWSITVDGTWQSQLTQTSCCSGSVRIREFDPIVAPDGSSVLYGVSSDSPWLGSVALSFEIKNISTSQATNLFRSSSPDHIHVYDWGNVVWTHVTPTPTPTPTNQIDLIAVFPGISNELMDMQAAANNEGLIVHDGPTWNAMKLTIPDGSPWIIPWGSVITVDRQITLPNNEIWVRLAQADGTNDAWVNLRNGQNGEYTYHIGLLDGVPELGDAEIITFTYDRRAAVEYGIAQGIQNSAFAIQQPVDFSRITHRTTGEGRFSNIVYSLTFGEVGQTASAVFISEILWMGGMPMIQIIPNECGSGALVDSGWRYCNRETTFTWRVHEGIGEYFTSGPVPALVQQLSVDSNGDGNPDGNTDGNSIIDALNASGLRLTGPRSGVSINQPTVFADEIRILGESSFPPGYINLNSGATVGTPDFSGLSVFLQSRISNIQGGDYLWIGPDAGDDHGFLIVGWAEAITCADALASANRAYFANYIEAINNNITSPIPYVVDFTRLQRVSPRPFYCSFYSDPISAYTPENADDNRYSFHNWFFYTMPNSIRITREQLFVVPQWSWTAIDGTFPYGGQE